MARSLTSIATGEDRLGDRFTLRTCPASSAGEDCRESLFFLFQSDISSSHPPACLVSEWGRCHLFCAGAKPTFLRGRYRFERGRSDALISRVVFLSSFRSLLLFQQCRNPRRVSHIASQQYI
jgi:hypothetical protein